jgi:hypothetical protein
MVGQLLFQRGVARCGRGSGGGSGCGDTTDGSTMCDMHNACKFAQAVSRY